MEIRSLTNLFKIAKKTNEAPSAEVKTRAPEAKYTSPEKVSLGDFLNNLQEELYQSNKSEQGLSFYS